MPLPPFLYRVSAFCTLDFLSIEGSSNELMFFVNFVAIYLEEIFFAFSQCFLSFLYQGFKWDGHPWSILVADENWFERHEGVKAKIDNIIKWFRHLITAWVILEDDVPVNGAQDDAQISDRTWILTTNHDVRSRFRFFLTKFRLDNYCKMIWKSERRELRRYTIILWKAGKDKIWCSNI